jgi:hypothetical protein
MTEAEWLACTDPELMLESLRGEASDRKLRLFTVACCRRIWHLLDDGRSREAVVIAERFADGMAGERERAIAADRARAVDPSERGNAAFAAYMAVEINSPPDHPDAALGLAFEAYSAAAYADPREVERRLADGNLLYFPVPSVRAAHCQFLRDLFGNPFRPAAIDRSWLTWNDGTVLGLARGIYDDRGYDRMPILGDALGNAGCGEESILDHCRSAAEHVRGCWVIDLLLGKE